MPEACVHDWLAFDAASQKSGEVEHLFYCRRCLALEVRVVTSQAEPDFFLLDFVKTDTGKIWIFWNKFFQFHFVREADLLDSLKQQNPVLHKAVSVSSAIPGVR